MSRKTLRFVLGDQLHRRISSLTDLDRDQDVVLMVEVREEATYVRHHKQKIALLFSAMRHFAAELEAEGVAVDYVRLRSRGNTGSFTGELERAISRHAPRHVIVTEPGEWRVWQMMQDWREDFSPTIEIREDNRFLCSRAEFEAWAGDRKSLLMESFYREMRRRTGWLMDGKEPEGGQWNFDRENRKRLPEAERPPARSSFSPDAVTRECIAVVAEDFADHFGSLDDFAWPVTRKGALKSLRHFIAKALPRFGDYQDAMRQGAPFLYHSLISPMLNAGLLTPQEVCEAAERAYRKGAVPLNCAEGFIRQILGWREYVRGLYWARMPAYAESNVLDAHRDLPWFYWSADTEMNCLRQCISETRDHAYAHHIQRLMVLGNFALLAGIEPRQVEEWYLIVYADAYDWVELPNVHGMVLWADGGALGSKPYAASGAYINRMSDYCAGCAYDVEAKAGESACPFNYLYWDFLIRNGERLRGNPRLMMPYRNLDRMSDRRRSEIVCDAERFLAALDSNPPAASAKADVSPKIKAEPSPPPPRKGRADPCRSRKRSRRTRET